MLLASIQQDRDWELSERLQILHVSLQVHLKNWGSGWLDKRPKKRYFITITVAILRRFQYHWHMCYPRVIHQPAESVQRQCSSAKVFVSINFCSQSCLWVVDMNCLEELESFKLSTELFHSGFIPFFSRQVVSSRVRMTCILPFLLDNKHVWAVQQRTKQIPKCSLHVLWSRIALNSLNLTPTAVPCPAAFSNKIITFISPFCKRFTFSYTRSSPFAMCVILW